jgi:pyruvate-ferredoxin/flavodoxin oxidoreductase
MRLAIEKKAEQAVGFVKLLAEDIGSELADDLVKAEMLDETGIAEQRARVVQLKQKLDSIAKPEAKRLATLADYLVRKSVWIFGGDGWAYDIGYGGLDHVLASGKNVNVLLMDTEVYSNTGGQMSKATPIGAVAKFAAAGKSAPKKDMGLLAMSYGNIYVARVAIGANDSQCLKAIVEAEAYPGPSLIIAYSHCIAHGYDLKHGLNQQKLAVDSGYWPLYRFHPENAQQGKNPLKLDSRAPKVPLREYMYNETRFKMLKKANPKRAEELAEKAQAHVLSTYDYYKHLADMSYSTKESE